MAARRRDRHHTRRGFFTKGSKSRRILSWALIIVGSVTTLIVIAYYQLLSHLQSPAFCKELSRQARQIMQAESVTLRDSLQIDNNRITLNAAELTQAGPIQALSAQGISTEIDRGAIWNRKLVVRKLTVEEAEIRLNVSPSSSAPKKDGGAPTVEAEEERTKSIGSNFAPNQFSLDFFECKDSDAHLVLGESQYSLHGCTTTATPQAKLGSNTWQINLENGRFHTPFTYLRDTSIKNATVIASPKEITLTESRLLLSPGELRARGSYNPKTKRWSAVLRSNKANVARILNPEWQKRLHGELYGELELTGKQQKLARGAGYLSLQKGVLEGLPILSDLQFHGTMPYRSIPLERAECRLSYPYNDTSHNIRNAWLFDQIDLRAANALLLVKGRVIVGEDKSLGGTLTIGLPESRFRHIPTEALQGIFSPKDDQGYVWVKLNLSGTLDDPQEDLTIRLCTVLSKAIPGVAGDASKAITELFSTITEQPENKTEDTSSRKKQKESTSPINSATDLFKNTLRSIF
ncbi:MAG: hypothetical protein IKV82_01775 [Akkermansia sp.]|nr:hypothetical protein [Akkermansia sp.]